MNARGLASQGAASRAGAYYGGNDPALVAYAQLAALLGSQGQTASALSDAELQQMLAGESFDRQMKLLEEQAKLQEQPFDWGALLGQLGGAAIGAFAGGPPGAVAGAQAGRGLSSSGSGLSGLEF